MAKQNVERRFIVDKSIKADFALKVKGDSMINAGIYEGDIVFIRQQPDIENGGKLGGQCKLKSLKQKQH